MTLALLITAVGGAWAQTVYNSTVAVSDLNEGDILIEGAQITLPSDHSYYLNFLQNRFFLNNATTPSISGFMHNTTTVTVGANGLVTGLSYDATARPATESGEEGNAWEVTAVEGKNVKIVGITYDASAIEVTTNAASEGATFTEASFQMPAFDATAEYELVRDMSVQMTATMGDGTDGVRYRVKKAQQGEGYEPADLNMMQVLALVAVNDGIEQKALTLNQDFFCRIYKLDEQTLQPVGDGMLLSEFNFAPGLYALKAFAQNGSDYDGETALSNTFKLFQGYEVTVPAGEYATYYKDENLYTEDEDAVLYTIASVTDTEAVLSDAITVAPAETPLLVYNKSEQDKIFLLIPTTDDADEVTPATQFVGTLEATTIPASATGADNYALNGYAFVWVKNAIEVGANKCWLHIASQHAAARAVTRSIVGGNGTTGIDAIENVTIDNEGWYDMQGRKLQAKPNRKGIYIHNGKKVVVRK